MSGKCGLFSYYDFIVVLIEKSASFDEFKNSKTLMKKNKTNIHLFF